MGTKLLGFSIGRGLGALKGLSFIFPHPPEDKTRKKTAQNYTRNNTRNSNIVNAGSSNALRTRHDTPPLFRRRLLRSGHIPNELSKLVELEQLFLGDNDLEGTSPPETRARSSSARRIHIQRSVGFVYVQPRRLTQSAPPSTRIA